MSRMIELTKISVDTVFQLFVTLRRLGFDKTPKIAGAKVDDLLKMHDFVIKNEWQKSTNTAEP